MQGAVPVTERAGQKETPEQRQAGGGGVMRPRDNKKNTIISGQLLRTRPWTSGTRLLGMGSRSGGEKYSGFSVQRPKADPSFQHQSAAFHLPNLNFDPDLSAPVFDSS